MPAEKDQDAAATHDADRQRYEQNLAAANETVERLQRDGKLSPQQIDGLAEFMAVLNAGGQPAEKTMRAFLHEFHSGSAAPVGDGDRSGKGRVN